MDNFTYIITLGVGTVFGYYLGHLHDEGTIAGWQVFVAILLYAVAVQLTYKFLNLTRFRNWWSKRKSN